MTIFRDLEDRERFLTTLAGVVESHRLTCHAYCEMSTHYHLVITTSDANLSRAIQELNGTYANWWNWRSKRVGHVFQGRFHAQIVQDGEYFRVACRYVVLNPVRAGLVRTPDEWHWSSYRGTVGLVSPPSFLTRDLLLSQLGDTSDGAMGRYREFVEQGRLGAPDMPTRGVPIFGDEGFVRRLRNAVDWTPGRVAAEDRRAVRPSLNEVFTGTVRRDQRNDAIGVAYRTYGYSRGEIASFLQLDPSCIGKVVRQRGHSGKK